ncbi:MAG: VOC family protein [Deltaproteobacteria bacterium]|nr:VOC family protein [Deltaproteobacteria bacterium]
MQGVMDHIVLNAADVEGLVRFYTEVVELEPERVEEFRGGKVPFPSVRVNAGTVIDLAPRAMWESTQLQTRGRPNLNHFCLTLEKVEWDKLRERLAAGQITIEGPLPRWGARGHGTSFYFHDPEGNEIEARYYGE